MYGEDDFYGASPRLPEGAGIYGVRSRSVACNVLSCKNDDFHPRSNACHSGDYFLPEVTYYSRGYFCEGCRYQKSEGP